MNRNKIFRKIDNNKLNQRKINKPQIKIETKHITGINDEIPFDNYSHHQLNIKDVNNFNHERLITDFKNYDLNTVDIKISRNSGNNVSLKNQINNNKFYKNHLIIKSTRHLSKINIPLKNEGIKEDNMQNLNINDEINKNNRNPFSKYRMLANNDINKINKKKITLNRPDNLIERSIYKNTNYSTNFKIDIAHDKNNFLLESGNKNKISKKNIIHIASTPTLNRNPHNNFIIRKKSFRPVNIWNDNH